MTVPGKMPKDEAVGRQYATKASVPSYSELTARHPPSSSSPAFQRQPPEAAAPRSSRSWTHPPANRSARREGQVQMLLLPAPPRDGASDA